MQTVQFKVLNTDTQETNVQMQTENTEAENKAQNTQNTEVSGVESAHLTVFQDLIQGLWLGSQYYKGGIPRMTPHRLASMLHSLPPILYM